MITVPDIRNAGTKREHYSRTGISGIAILEPSLDYS